MPFLSRRLRYQVYILRMWQESSPLDSPAVWRFSLENTDTDQRYGFTSAEAVAQFLRTVAGREKTDPATPRNTRTRE